MCCKNQYATPRSVKQFIPVVSRLGCCPCGPIACVACTVAKYDKNPILVVSACTVYDPIAIPCTVAPSLVKLSVSVGISCNPIAIPFSCPDGALYLS